MYGSTLTHTGLANSVYARPCTRLMTYLACVTIHSHSLARLASLYNCTDTLSLHCSSSSSSYCLTAVCSNHCLYFTSRSLANFSAPTVLLRKAAHKVCHVGLGPIFSHVLSIFLRQCCEFSGLSDLMVSSVPSSSSSCSPRSYHLWEMSIRSSYTFFRSIGFWTVSITDM